MNISLILLWASLGINVLLLLVACFLLWRLWNAYRVEQQLAGWLEIESLEHALSTKAYRALARAGITTETIPAVDCMFSM